MDAWKFEPHIAQAIFELTARGKVVKFSGDALAAGGEYVLKMEVIDKDWDESGLAEPPAYIASLALPHTSGLSVNPDETSILIANFIRDTAAQIHEMVIRKYRQKNDPS